MKNHLLIKLLSINFLIILITVIFIWLALDYLAADYFSALMKNYHISPTETHDMFIKSVHRYLVGVGILTILTAIGFSFLLTRRVLRPLSEINLMIQRISNGDFSARVQQYNHDEIGELGIAFNHMTDSLERVEKLRHNMVIDMAHELRTPLTNIRGYLEALQDGVVIADSNTINLLQTEVFRLIDMIDDLQRLARADAADGLLSKKVISVSELLKDVIKLYQPKLIEKNLSIKCTVSPDNLKVNADRDKLLQIFSNLIQNACTYSDKNSNITIDATKENGFINFFVSNHCKPLNHKDLSLIFERFYRVDKSRSRESGGAGIGLAIVKQLVEAHKGQTGAENIANGIRIWFSLPA